MGIFAGELLGVRGGFGMRSAVGVTFHGDGRNGNDRRFREALFDVVVLALTVCESEAPAIVVNDDGDVVGIVECRGAAVVRGVAKVPLRRSELPDELRKVVTIFFVAGAAAFCSEIKL